MAGSSVHQEEGLSPDPGAALGTEPDTGKYARAGQPCSALISLLDTQACTQGEVSPEWRGHSPGGNEGRNVGLQLELRVPTSQQHEGEPSLPLGLPPFHYETV